FQAADGIRDFHVTGVQTCALPIYEIKSALNSDFKIPLSFKFKAFAARNVIPLRTSAIDNFSKVARIDACVSKSPIGAEPGFQSEIGRASCRERVSISEDGIAGTAR